MNNKIERFIEFILKMFSTGICNTVSINQLNDKCLSGCSSLIGQLFISKEKVTDGNTSDF